MADLEKLRRDAEERARWLTHSKGPDKSNKESLLRRRFRTAEEDIFGEEGEAGPKAQPTRSSSSAPSPEQPSQILLNNSKHTSEVARLAALEFKVNGSRARDDIRNFVRPRWELDEEAPHCRCCQSTFDCFNRRHHCRVCGKIFCGNCSSQKVLLPPEYNTMDPQRVCIGCHRKLAPLQEGLSQTQANHKRINYLELSDGSCRRFLNSPVSLTLGSDIRKAAYSVINFCSLELLRDKFIPLELIKGARGLLFLTVVKAGFILGGRGGTGLVISRLPDNSWSAPSAVGLAGISWGFMAGADVTDYVIILNSEDALMPFTSRVQVNVGLELEVTAGPIGRVACAEAMLSEAGFAPTFSYSHSRGALVGASLEGSVVFPRDGVNHRFYGMPLSPADLLSGRVPRPRAAAPLYDALERALFHPAAY